MQKKPSLDGLTGLRFIAAFAVFNLHFMHLDQWFDGVPESLKSMTEAGGKGVALFFILSGFILAYAYSDIEPSRESRTKFWINRFARVYPVYLLAFLWIAPAFLAHRFATEPVALALQKSIMAGVPSVLLLQSWVHPRLAISWNGPGWTLSVEMLFYMVFPFAAVWMRKFSRHGLICAAVVLLALSGSIAVMARYVFEMGSVVSGYLHTHPLANLPTFFSGIALGYYFQRTTTARTTAHLCFVAGAAVCIVCASFPGGAPALAEFAFLPAIALVIFGVANDGGPPAFLKSKTMITLGEASYAFYLLQFGIAGTVDWMLKSLMSESAFTGFYDGPAYYFVLLIITVSASILVFRYVETPMRSLVQKALIKKLIKPSPGSAETSPLPSAIIP